MGEVLLHYTPPLLAWALYLSRRPGEDRGRRCVRRVLLGLAVSLTALAPAVYAAVGDLSGVKHLARLVGHGSMLFAVWAAQEFLSHMNGSPRGARWHAWWTAAAFAAMCLLFALSPGLHAWSPGVLEYCVGYLVGQAPALGNVIRLGLRYARTTRDRTLRLSLHLVVAGTGGALLYLVNKVVLTASARYGFAYPAGRTLVVSTLLPASTHVLVLVGATLPALLGWLRRYLLYRRLGPLWRALYRANPAIALDPPVVPDALAVSRLRLRLYRRVIEIRDGLLTSRPYRNPEIATTARRQATTAGLRGAPLEAAVEAAVIAAVLRSRPTHHPPSTLDKTTLTGGTDLDSDTAFLSQVAHAYRKHHATRLRRPRLL